MKRGTSTLSLEVPFSPLQGDTPRPDKSTINSYMNMVANVQVSNDIAFSLSYAQNHEKGGEIFLCNLTDETASVQEQIKDWEAMTNNYRNKCYNIVISLSDKDTEKIRQIKDVRKRVSFERFMIKSFLDELATRGNNVYDSPFIVAHHGNTNNEHFHICILNTNIYGKHLRDSFIKKNACRAAAKVSEQLKLEAPARVLRNERNHQKAIGERAKKSKENGTKREYTNVQEDHTKLKYRAERIRLAQKRKARCKFIIESIAKDEHTDKDNFVDKLSKAGLELHHDEKLGFFIIIHDDEEEDKKYYYQLKKHLNMDLSILPNVDTESISMPWKLETATTKESLSAPVKSVEKPQVTKSTPQTSKPSHSVNAGKTIQKLGKPAARGEQTMQGNVNPDGSYNEDDLDEKWKRRSSYHY